MTKIAAVISPLVLPFVVWKFLKVFWDFAGAEWEPTTGAFCGLSIRLVISALLLIGTFGHNIGE